MTRERLNALLKVTGDLIPEAMEEHIGDLESAETELLPRETLLTVLNVLKGAGIQIIASTISDTQDFGIYRIICDDPERAFIVLKEQGITATITDVFAIQLEDKPGEAARVLALFAEADISIAYMYSFLLSGKGILVFRSSDTEKTKQVIKEKSLQEFC